MTTVMPAFYNLDPFWFGSFGTRETVESVSQIEPAANFPPSTAAKTTPRAHDLID
ncbi:hypothetical protein CO2235_200124 [Cupriavidus oxalaticus]|uniref:Uncharacterized protein n=1 Tax=Cupriavidus oxalaticus TaxID=96344 RepID=A0A976BCX3_9BURK|nr:hypothetical protein CO2235_200124 [Cupriavidus oxalaticus]